MLCSVENLCEGMHVPTGDAMGMEAHIIERSTPRAESGALAALRLARTKRVRRRVLMICAYRCILVC